MPSRLSRPAPRRHSALGTAPAKAGQWVGVVSGSAGQCPSGPAWSARQRSQFASVAKPGLATGQLLANPGHALSRSSHLRSLPELADDHLGAVPLTLHD